MSNQEFVGPHDNLNDERLSLSDHSIDEIAEKVVRTNYGVSRFLSALVRVLERKGEENPEIYERGDKQVVESLKELVSKK